MRWLTGFFFFLVPCLNAAPQPAPKLEIKPGEGKKENWIDFKVGGKLVARYQIDPKFAKPFFEPVHAPTGQTVTRGWPPAKGEARDHPHQKSLWFCHGDVIPEGLELKSKIKNVAGVDFWSEHKGHGKIVCVEHGKVENTDDGGLRVLTTNEWRTAEGTRIMDETRNITLYSVQGGYLLVLDIDLHASAYPITFADTKEGCLGVRVRESLRTDRGKGKLVNAEGKSGEKTVWGRKSAWNDYSGPAGDSTAGIAIFQSPKNKVDAVWHSRGYGLMAANLFGRAKRSKFPDRKGNNELVKLKKGDHLKLRFGVFLHKGDVKEGKVAEAFTAFTKLK